MRGDAPRSIECREFGIIIADIIDGGNTGLGTFKATLLSLNNPSLLNFEFMDDIEAEPKSSIRCRRRPFLMTYVALPSVMSLGGITSSKMIISQTGANKILTF